MSSDSVGTEKIKNMCSLKILYVVIKYLTSRQTKKHGIDFIEPLPDFVFFGVWVILAMLRASDRPCLARD